jgi:hypothetical protein
VLGIKRSLSVTFSTLCIELSRLVKVSFMQGSSALFFSCVNIAAPMVGVLGGLNVAIYSFSLQVILKFLLLGAGIIPLIGYHIPHIFASAYWNSNYKLAKILIPLACMVLFILHPCGYQAWAYAMLWLIPMVLAFVNNNIFLKALGSTFVAHAIGSVIWIYSVPMTSMQWIGLIPNVIAERVLFASAMVIVYYSFYFTKSYLTQKIFALKLKELLKLF